MWKDGNIVSFRARLVEREVVVVRAGAQQVVIELDLDPTLTDRHDEADEHEVDPRSAGDHAPPRVARRPRHHVVG